MGRRNKGLAHNTARYKNRKRQHFIDLARLLGYTIEPYKATHAYGESLIGQSGYMLCKDGKYLSDPEFLVPRPKKFAYMWRAAEWALKREGVDVSKISPPREDGVRTRGR